MQRQKRWRAESAQAQGASAGDWKAVRTQAELHKGGRGRARGRERGRGLEESRRRGKQLRSTRKRSLFASHLVFHSALFFDGAAGGRRIKRRRALSGSRDVWKPEGGWRRRSGAMGGFFEGERLKQRSRTTLFSLSPSPSLCRCTFLQARALLPLSLSLSPSTAPLHRPAAAWPPRTVSRALFSLHPAMSALKEKTVLAKTRVTALENVRTLNCWGSNLQDVRAAALVAGGRGAGEREAQKGQGQASGQNRRRCPLALATWRAPREERRKGSERERESESERRKKGREGEWRGREREGEREVLKRRIYREPRRPGPLLPRGRESSPVAPRDRIALTPLPRVPSRV